MIIGEYEAREAIRAAYADLDDAIARGLDSADIDALDAHACSTELVYLGGAGPSRHRLDDIRALWADDELAQWAEHDARLADLADGVEYGMLADAVLMIVRSDAEVSTTDVAAELGVDYQDAASALHYLAHRGDVVRVARGTWRAT